VLIWNGGGAARWSGGRRALATVGGGLANGDANKPSQIVQRLILGCRIGAGRLTTSEGQLTPLAGGTGYPLPTPSSRKVLDQALQHLAWHRATHIEGLGAAQQVVADAGQ